MSQDEAIRQAFNKWLAAKLETGAAMGEITGAPSWSPSGDGDVFAKLQEAKRAEADALRQAREAYRVAGRNWTHGA